MARATICGVKRGNMSVQSNALAACVLIACLLAPNAAVAMNKKQCAAAKWDVLGFSDLLEGRNAATFEDRKSDCEKKKFVVDVDAYRRGEERATPIYCSTTFGLAYGSYGFKYHGICPPELEKRFLTAYTIGNQYYPILKAAESAEGSLNASQFLLDSSISDYNRAVATMNNPKSTPEERSKAAKSATQNSKAIREWQPAVARDQTALTYALQDLLAAENQREDQINAADLFPREAPYNRDKYPISFEDAYAVSGAIELLTDEKTQITVALAEPIPLAPVEKAVFFLDATTPHEFVSRRGLQNNRACRVTRKTNGAMRKLARGLKKQSVSSAVTELVFLPPDSTKKYTLVQNPPSALGDLRLSDGQTVGEKFIAAGLAAPLDGEPSSKWYKSDECNP